MAGEHIQELRRQIIEARVTQTYGETNFEHPHAGVDLVLPSGAGVRAPLTGTVEVKDTGSAGFGKHVRIHSAVGYTALMGHLQSFNVHDGQQIRAGEIVGTQGSTGWSTGPHVHYGLYGPFGREDPGLGAHSYETLDRIPAATKKAVRDNWFFNMRHNLGFGSGDDPGHSSLDHTAPLYGEIRAPVAHPLHRNSGVTDPPGGGSGDPNPPGDTDPGPIGIPIGTIIPGDVSPVDVALAVGTGVLGLIFVIMGLRATGADKPIRVAFEPVRAAGKAVGTAVGTAAKTVVPL